MAVPERRRSRNWRFRDVGSRFDTSQRAVRDSMPISPAFTRHIVRCRRCGSRIVTNSRRCPYCGKSVVPFYRSFVFWLVIVVLLAAGTFYFVLFYDPQPATPVNTGHRSPVAVMPGSGGTAGLPLGTTVDDNGMLITVLSVSQSHTASDGRTIYEASVLFYNMTNSRQSLLTTQWLMRNTDGSYAECFIGQSSSGVSLTSGVEGRQLAPYEMLTAKVYFASDSPLSLVYLVNPLNADEGPEVSWQIGAALPASDGD